MDEIKQEPNLVENTPKPDPNQAINQITVAIVIAGLLIAGAIFFKGNTSPANPKTQVATEEDLSTKNIPPINAKDHITGKLNAKIVIVEYSDTECPFCKTFHTTMQKIIAQKEVDVAWVYRHNPIPQLHAKALHEAEATECAFDQGGNDAFWKYIDRMFAITPSNDGLDEKELMNIADYVGLNSSSFYTCLQSGKYTNQIETAMNEARQAGVEGTPTSFIFVDGKLSDIIQGAQPYDVVLNKLKALK